MRVAPEVNCICPLAPGFGIVEMLRRSPLRSLYVDRVLEGMLNDIDAVDDSVLVLYYRLDGLGTLLHILMNCHVAYPLIVLQGTYVNQRWSKR